VPSIDSFSFKSYAEVKTGVVKITMMLKTINRMCLSPFAKFSQFFIFGRPKPGLSVTFIILITPLSSFFKKMSGRQQEKRGRWGRVIAQKNKIN
jgi:hypothetical protein